MAPCNHKGPFTQEEGAEEKQENTCPRVAQPHVAGFAGGGRGYQPRNVGEV